MKKVLFLISYLDKGGSERALSNITQNFPEDWEIDILVNNDKVVDYPYRANIISMCIDEKPKTESVWFQFKVLWKRIIWLRKLKKNGDYSACISFLDSANIANILSGKKYCKIIVSVRNSLKKQTKLPQYRFVVNPLVKLMYNKADKVVACSRGVEKELLDIFNIKKSKVCTVENGYDIAELREKTTEPIEKEILEKIDGKRVVVTTGRLTKQKGQWHLLRAFSDVIKSIPEAMLIIIGAGELESYLKDLVNEYGIGDQVIFLGYTNNPFKYERIAEVFVLPSLYEGFPNALGEALCLGLPCVATSFETGAEELLGQGYGILSPVCSGIMYDAKSNLEKSEKQLADNICSILESESMRIQYSQRANEKSLELNIKNVVNKWLDIIGESK